MVILAIALVLAVALGGSSSSSLKDVPAVGSLSTGLPGRLRCPTTLQRHPAERTTLGSSIAPVTMVEFIDPQCPYCQEFETQVLPDVIKRYVRTGKVKIQMQPWAFIGPDSFRGQAAELAAAEQNKAFNYTALLYDNQGDREHRLARRQHGRDHCERRPRAEGPRAARRTIVRDGEGCAGEGRRERQGVRRHGNPTLFVGKSGARGTQVNLTGPNRRSIGDSGNQRRVSLTHA